MLPQEVDDETVINIRENWRDNTETQATLDTRHRTQTNKHNVENKKKTSNTDLPKNPEVNSASREGLAAPVYYYYYLEIIKISSWTSV